MNRYCANCHGAQQQKGKIRFDTLASLEPADQSVLLERAHEALHFGEMPPDDKPQPTDAERSALMAWLKSQLDPEADAKLKDKMRYPHYGNLVDHEQLFSGAIDEPAYTPARRWLVSPQIFNERIIEVFKLEGPDRQEALSQGFAGVTNPFLLPDHSGVRYYDTDAMDGGDLLAMLSNAGWIADRQIAIARRLGGEQITFDNPKDRWMPRQLPESYRVFLAVITADVMPSEQALYEAIRQQFDCVLRREPTPEELAQYTKLMRASVGLSDNTAGLKQMLKAVLLESEFVYRLEFGAGEPDAYGRKMLTPLEGAIAISYALGDRRPDDKLMEAARGGRLQTRQDYEREIRRLLEDKEYYRGKVDPKLDSRHYRSNIADHPKIVRFFREFFGYPAATKVFKDPPRSGNIYRNPDRGTSGTPGWLIVEADRIVTHHIDHDQGVLENLLGSDEFYVYHNMSNDRGAELVDQWRVVYEKLRDTNWREDPKGVLDAHRDLLSEHEVRVRISGKNEKEEIVDFSRWMHFFHETFGQGITPFTRHPTTFGFNYYHSVFYSLPPVAVRQRYGWRGGLPKIKADEAPEFWDYAVEQPFRIPNRKGILTHPAWLIAHSTNFHADPIRRGRWIREKLLAGRVPDVPITVDAQVPEDPHRTFRQRVEAVTAPDECWKCHKHMNPLGLPFEAYDDFGRFRTEEVLEHPDNLIKKGNNKTTFDQYPSKAIRLSGALSGTGDPALDGEVDDPFELIDRLAQSDRARQSIIRHAFRFYMGRNEMISDSQTLIDADRAYLESGGSFKAVIVSLLTSDSFLYRKDQKD